MKYVLIIFLVITAYALGAYGGYDFYKTTNVGVITLKLNGANGKPACSEVVPYSVEGGLGVVRIGTERPEKLPWGGTRYNREVKTFRFAL